MSSRGMRWMLAATLLSACCAAWGQSTPDHNAPDHSSQEALPSLPPGPAPAPLILPKNSGPVTLHSSRPQDVPPPAPPPDDEESFCTTPSDTAYRTNKPQTAETKKALADYTWNVKRRIWENWKVPREINDPWLKSAQVRLKFEILADGSLNDPVIMMASGRASYDRQALESVKKSAPFPPPPAAAIPVKVCFRFGYNMNPDDHGSMPVDIFAPKKAKP